METSSFEEYRAWRDGLNKAKQTDPPTAQLGDECDGKTNWRVKYEDQVIVQWVCKCGSKDLDVFYEEGCYRTFAKCRACGFQDDIHTG